MAKATSKTEKIVAKNMREVFDTPPSTLKPGQSAEARRKQQVAIGLSKAREAGADVPAKPTKKRGSKASY
jgi:Family of unknown function (DUF6496)